MKPSQPPWKWLLLGPVAVLLVGIVSAPWILGDQTRFADAVAERISAWSEGRARFIGPVQVSIVPELSVRGRLELTDSKRLPFLRMLKVKEAKASLDLPELLRGRVRIDVLRLQKPKVQLNEDYATAAARPDAIVSSVLSSIPARSLFIRNGEIALASEPIKHIHAHVDAGKENGALAMLGFFSYRQERVRLAIESGSTTRSGETELVPMSISISSIPIRGKLSSTASFGPTFKLDGGIEAQIGDLRRFWRWVGYAVPEGPSLKGLSLAGGFHFSGSTFAVENGVFTLDGNRAIGVVALTTKTRPRIEGTLAFDQLVLDPYFDDGSPATPPGGSDYGLDALLLRYIDADLRVSANTISVKSLALGSGGFTVSARNGSVASEIGELELCGGRASGRIDLDLAGDKKTLGAAATISEISLEPCLAPFSLGVPVQGTGDLTLDLSAEGSSQAELIGNLSGNISVSARAGTVPLDLPRFLATSTPVEATGWRDSGSSSFDRLQADCALGSGLVRCETLSLQTGDEKVAVAGDIDLPKGTLNWEVSVDSSHGPVSVSVPSSKLRPALSIRGPLSQPSIRRTDRASFGEGRAPSQDPNKVQPH